MRLGGVGRAVIVASCFWMAGGTLFIAGGIEDANLVWREAAGGATLLLVLALILFGAIYVSIRWVLAGRKRTPLDPVR